MDFRHFFIAFSFIITFVLGAHVAFAQLEFLEGYEDKYIRHDQGVGAEKIFNTIDNNTSNYVYEIPTLKALSHLYWAVNLYSLDDDFAVDQFMHHNECEIYRNFYSDEFEWTEVRNATRNFIRENKNDFPTRFQFMIPIKLKDFDKRKGAFQVQERFQINSIRRFEVYASNYRKKPCTDDIRVADDYPRVLVLEFSRPFSLDSVPMSEDVANAYIKKNIEKLKRYDPSSRIKSRMYSLRDAYLVIKVKIFAHGKFLPPNILRFPMVQMLAVMEGYEVYEDRYKQNLFFAESYVSNKGKGKLDIKLQDEYNILIQRSEGKGIFHREL